MRVCVVLETLDDGITGIFGVYANEYLARNEVVGFFERTFGADWYSDIDMSFYQFLNTEVVYE